MKRAFDEGWGAVIAKTVSFFTLSLFFSFLFNIYIYIYIYIYIFFWDSFDRVILEVGTYQC